MPEGRTRIRPWGASLAEASAMARWRTSSASHWSRCRTRMARCCCGRSGIERASSPRPVPAVVITRSSSIAVRIPSPDSRVLPDDHVAALLAAEAGARDQHRREDVLVTDGSPDQASAGRLHRLLQAPVREDRHHEAPVVEGAAGKPLQGEDPQDLVAVHEPAAGVDRHAPVRVPVEREAHVRPVGPRPLPSATRAGSRRSRG